MPNIQKVSASLTKEKVAALKEVDKEKYARLPNEGTGKVEVEYDFGGSPEEAGKYFKPDVVMRLLNFAISHPIQSRIRDGLVAGLADGKPVATIVKEIQASIYANGKHVWVPGMATARKSAVEKERDRLNKIEDPVKKAEEMDALRKLLAEMEG